MGSGHPLSHLNQNTEPKPTCEQRHRIFSIRRGLPSLRNAGYHESLRSQSNCRPVSQQKCSNMITVRLSRRHRSERQHWLPPVITGRSDHSQSVTVLACAGVMLAMLLMSRSLFAETWVEDSFADFADGRLDASGQNIYVSHDGRYWKLFPGRPSELQLQGYTPEGRLPKLKFTGESFPFLSKIFI